MPDKPLPFVVNDRRKFTSEGELRPDADPSPERPAPTPISSARPASEPAEPAAKPDSLPSLAAAPAPAASSPQEDDSADPMLPPAPDPAQMEQARVAYTATADRLDIAIRAANPGLDHPPPMTFDQLVQSVYMQAILQLGGGTQQGQQPQVDILGARQSIDMLAVLADKTAGNLSTPEQRLIDSALFELRLAFLEITQALARQPRPGAPPTGPAGFGPPPGKPAPAGRSGPSIVR